MTESYTGKKTDKLCTACNEGWLHDYPQDAPGVLRCGRCGEPHEPKTAVRQPAKTLKEKP